MGHDGFPDELWRGSLALRRHKVSVIECLCRIPMCISDSRTEEGSHRNSAGGTSRNNEEGGV